jgi:hypothetical protein
MRVSAANYEVFRVNYEVFRVNYEMIYRNIFPMYYEFLDQPHRKCYGV